jgi:hypothetical protein
MRCFDLASFVGGTIIRQTQQIILIIDEYYLHCCTVGIMSLSMLKGTLQKPLRRLILSTYKNNVTKRGIKSLALTTYFMQPDLGMTEYEDLCRGTAFLLAVDPPDPSGKGPYGHLEAAEVDRTLRDFKRKKNFTPPIGKGNAKDMGWLEFMPREYRPNVHVLTTSHVVSPFLWLDYYPHDWLTQVRQEHW